jgi:hypothetical protein
MNTLDEKLRRKAELESELQELAHDLEATEPVWSALFHYTNEDGHRAAFVGWLRKQSPDQLTILDRIVTDEKHRKANER